MIPYHMLIPLSSLRLSTGGIIALSLVKLVRLINGLDERISRKCTGYFNGNIFVFFLSGFSRFHTMLDFLFLPVSEGDTECSSPDSAKQESDFFPPIPDRHLNFISSSITWPLLRTARRYKNKFLKDSAFATTTIGNTPSPFFPTAVHS